MNLIITKLCLKIKQLRYKLCLNPKFMSHYIQTVNKSKFWSKMYLQSRTEKTKKELSVNENDTTFPLCSCLEQTNA